VFLRPPSTAHVLRHRQTDPTQIEQHMGKIHASLHHIFARIKMAPSEVVGITENTCRKHGQLLRRHQHPARAAERSTRTSMHSMKGFARVKMAQNAVAGITENECRKHGPLLRRRQHSARAAETAIQTSMHGMKALFAPMLRQALRIASPSPTRVIAPGSYLSPTDLRMHPAMCVPCQTKMVWRTCWERRSGCFARLPPQQLP